MRLLDQSDDLVLLGCRISHASSSPSPLMLFLSRRFSRVRSATTSFKAVASRRRSFTSPDVAARAVSPANRRLPVAHQAQSQATQGRDLSTLAPLRALRAGTPVPACARLVGGEGVKCCPHAC